MNHTAAASEEKFRILFETMHEGFAMHEVVFDEAGTPVDCRYLDINPAFERLTGLSRDAVVGCSVREVLPHLDEKRIEIYYRVAMTGEPAEAESFVHDLGRYYRARIYSPERGKFVVVFEDVTEQKKAMLELTRREELLRVVFEASRAGILMVDAAGSITFANQRMAEMLGCSMDELLFSRYPDHVHSEQRATGDDRMRKLIAGEIDHVATERHFIRKDGTDFWGYLSGKRYADADGNFNSLVGHITDISDLKGSTRTLELYSYALDNARDSIFLLGSTARFQFVNNAVCETLGYSRQELLEMHVFDIDPDFPPEIWARHWEELRELGAMRVETRHRARDGSMIPVELNIRFFLFDGNEYILALARDLTERRKFESERHNLEQQLLHTQKLESLGVLAGGIAHDFNNILMAIMGNADLALMRINKESPAVENLHRIEKAAAQAADLAKQMLAYSGKGKFVIESLDLNLLLEEMLHMLEVSISKKAVLRLNLTKPLPPVEADATQMRQIIMNLVINASEAIGDTSGVIAITTGCMDCDRSYLKDVWLDENITAGLYVYLEIADTGCGMDKETLSKLFDPFFTTKFTGRGLGMAAVLGIVRGHKGAIKVYSEPGKGTSFKILLPASGRPAELFNGETHGSHWHGTGKVLLVDDEETVRGIGVEMLKELGFETITANDGREGIEIFRQTPDIAFVILDLTMPHMDGEQCFRELRQLQPDVKVIMSSGYNEQEVTQLFLGKGLAGFIQKPYRFSTLQEAVQNLLAQSTENGLNGAF